MGCHSQFSFSIREQYWKHWTGCCRLKSGWRMWSWGRGESQEWLTSLRGRCGCCKSSQEKHRKKRFWNYCDFIGEFEEIIFPLKKKEEIIKIELFSSSERKDLDPQTTENHICGEHHVKGWGQQTFSWPTLWERWAWVHGEWREWSLLWLWLQEWGGKHGVSLRNGIV